MRKPLLYLLACLVLVSCSKSDSKENQPTELFCYPAQVTTHTTYNNGSKESVEMRYTYNNRGELVAIKFYADGSLIQEYTYEYDSEGLIIRENTFLANGDLTDFITYEHDAAGKVKSSSFFFYDPQQQKSTLFEKYDWFYTSPTQLSTMATYKEVNGQLRQVLRSEYTYENGLMTRAQTYTMSDVLVKETALTYDGKHNMLIGLERIRLTRVGEGFPHTQNVVTRVVKDHQGEVFAGPSFSSELEYNEKGYRTRSLALYQDGATRESQVIYNCPEK